MFETLTVEVDGAVGELCLNRPEKLNPLSARALEDLAEAARHFDTLRDVKVVVVRGAGRAFSAGADLESFSRRDATHTPREVGELGREMADAIESMRAVTVAAIQGWCVGGGLVLAAACDLRLAAEGTRFSIPEVDLGIPLAWGGIPRLVREIGPARTKELVMTCRVFDTAEAHAIGFLNEVLARDELEARARTLAADLAKKAACATLATKRHVNAVTDQMVGTMRSWSDADGLALSLADPEGAAARRAYLESKR